MGAPKGQKQNTWLRRGGQATRAILECLREGYSTQEIVDELGVHKETISKVRKQWGKKKGVS